MPDVRRVLDRLAAAGHSMAVASNKPAEFSRRILETKRVAQYFLAIAGPDAEAPAKPHPAMLLRMMARAGAAPEQTIVVGDMEIDAEFARAAGCHSVLVPGGSRSAEELAAVSADAHLVRLAELPGWIGGRASAAAGDIGTS
jgi:phosphoglycolate phosphatase